MYIIHVASEMTKIAKVGGLGDVVHALPKEQQSKGNRVEVILPKYDIIDLDEVKNLSIDVPDLWVTEDNFKFHNTVWKCTVDDIDVKLIDPHHNNYYFNRGCIYGCLNDVERFLYFARATIEYLYANQIKPDILHIHDWQTAAIAPLAKTLYNNLDFSPGKIVFTIHNMEHQGKCPPKSLSRIGLRGEELRTEDRMQDPLDDTLVNLLKGGIVYSDVITTVSPTYAEEIKNPEFGFGLEDCIQLHEHKLQAVLNGIDTETWNPATDKHLHTNYPSNASFLDEIIERKQANKIAAFKQLDCKPSSKGPLVVAITRIAKQKGHKLLQEAANYILSKGGIFVLLGSSHDRQMEKEFHQLGMLHKMNPNLQMRLVFNEELAHILYAGADMILIPSIFEPCGLTQMISMRYGTVPLVRATGGLADTVCDLDCAKATPIEKTGFTFEEPEPEALNKALSRSFDCFHKEPKRWRELMKNGLNQDLSWKTSATHYQDIYNRALKKRDVA